MSVFVLFQKSNIKTCKILPFCNVFDKSNMKNKVRKKLELRFAM